MNEFDNQSELPEGATLITDHQTQGRGQRGNRWETEPWMNLTFSILLRPTFLEAKDLFQLNMAVSLAIADALQRTLPHPIKLKWPNDILVDDKKIGGILIESQLQGFFVSSSIIGIGINVNQENFLHPAASSLYNFSEALLDLDDTFQRLIEAIEQEYLDLRARKVTALKQRYLASLYKFNEPHRFETEKENFVGAISDIDDDGRLCVAQQGKTRKFSFKEIRFLN